MNSKGFTLIELLLAISLLSLLILLIFPFSLSLYNFYIKNLEIERVITILNHLKRRAYLYNQEYIIWQRDNKLYVNDQQIEIKRFSFYLKKPIRIYPKGTSSGGEIFLIFNEKSYTIEITPLGEIVLKHE